MSKQLIAKPQLTFSEALNTAKPKWADFIGRSRRSEFWYCALAALLTNFVSNFIPILGSLIQLAVSLLMIPLGFRRLHDIGRSGWWLGANMIIAVITSGVVAFSVVGEMSGAFNGGNIDPEDIVIGLLHAFSSIPVLIMLLLSMVSSIILLVFYVQDSQPEPNKYGDSPKYVIEEI